MHGFPPSSLTALRQAASLSTPNTPTGGVSGMTLGQVVTKLEELTEAMYEITKDDKTPVFVMNTEGHTRTKANVQKAGKENTLFYPSDLPWYGPRPEQTWYQPRHKRTNPILPHEEPVPNLVVQRVAEVLGLLFTNGDFSAQQGPLTQHQQDLLVETFTTIKEQFKDVVHGPLMIDAVVFPDGLSCSGMSIDESLKVQYHVSDINDIKKSAIPVPLIVTNPFTQTKVQRADIIPNHLVRRMVQIMGTAQELNEAERFWLTHDDNREARRIFTSWYHAARTRRLKPRAFSCSSQVFADNCPQSLYNAIESVHQMLQLMGASDGAHDDYFPFAEVFHRGRNWKPSDERYEEVSM